MNLLLKQARALVQSEHEVTLAGFHAWTLHELTERNRVELSSVRIESAGYGDSALALFRMFPAKLSAYSALLHPSFAPWIRHVLKLVRPDVVWFHDDIPRCAVPHLGNAVVRLYVHYPLMARRLEVTPPLRQTAGSAELWNDRLLRLCHVVCDPQEVRPDCIHSNSTITRRAVRAVWGLDSKVVYSYVGTGVASKLDGHLVVALGTVSRGKNYLGLLKEWKESLGTSGVPDSVRLRIIGYSRDASCLNQLRRAIRELGIGDSASIVTDLPASEVKRQLSIASIIVHPALFEPFGLALLEGMAAGLVPIVRKSEWAGGWVDILDRDRWGMSYGDHQPLAAAVARAFTNRDELARLATERARSFSEERFRSAYQDDSPK